MQEKKHGKCGQMQPKRQQTPSENTENVSSNEGKQKPHREESQVRLYLYLCDQVSQLNARQLTKFAQLS
ncbi:hypothetical protein ACLD5W_02465 [Gardnerella greenwoodii]|uniref:hypothetical protein n=1 Tax=Gardnerella greenwoodii TaxID=2914925 RepID=UPI0039707D72